MGPQVDRMRRAFVSALRAARRWKLVAAPALLLLATAAAPPQPGASGRFLALSDIHFDPFADPAIVPRLIAEGTDRWPGIFASSRMTAPAAAGSDTNYPLLDSTLKAASAAAGPERYDFVLLTGDLLRHDFEDQFAKYGGADKAALSAFTLKTMAFVNRELERRFRAPLIEALGNNDNDCGDYQPRPGAPFLAGTAATLPALAGNRQALADFAAGGNYAFVHPRTPNHLFLVLDSVFWSPKYRDACGASGDEAAGSAQLAWLEWQLFRARQRGQTVSLVMHIPPGINPYESTAAKPVPFWTDSWRDRFLAIAQAYAPILTAGYAGHTHMDDFRILSGPAGPIFAIRITPSVTPLFGNNPTFSVMRYTVADARPTGYTSYVFQSGAWKPEYEFARTYGYDSYSAANLTALSAAIRAGGNDRAAYARFYPSGAKSPITDANAAIYACAQTEILPAGFAACVGGAPRPK